MSALGTDLEALKDGLCGEIASLEAAAGTLRKAGDAMDRKARRKRAKLHRVVRHLAEIAAVESENEERARAAAAVPADEEN